MFLGGHVAQHGSTQPGYLRASDGRGDVVIAGGNVCDDGAEGVEGCLVAMVQLPLHVLADAVHGNVAGSLDEGLYVLLPGTGDEFAHSVQFGKLSRIVGIGRTSGTKSVAQ